jgi:CRISPR-associated endoribonuclease Cas6
MRLIINLDGGNEVPYDHSYLLYSAVINAVRSVDTSLASAIHNNSHYPWYCLSQLLPGGKREYTKTGMKAERFIFLISSLDTAVLEKIKAGIERQENIFVGNIEMSVHSTMMETPYISSGIVNMISRSPIVLKSEGRYVSSKDEDFQSVLQNNITSKYAKVKQLLPRIKFMRITSAKSKLSALKGIRIPSTMVNFTISADYDLIDFIASVGIGSKTQMGFGFIEEQRRVSNNGL